jgi:hypothetical protein
MDKQANVAIEKAILEQQDKFNYEEEMANLDEYCCADCAGQAAYYLRKDHK